MSRILILRPKTKQSGSIIWQGVPQKNALLNPDLPPGFSALILARHSQMRQLHGSYLPVLRKNDRGDGCNRPLEGSGFRPLLTLATSSLCSIQVWLFWFLLYIKSSPRSQRRAFTNDITRLITISTSLPSSKMQLLAILSLLAVGSVATANAGQNQDLYSLNLTLAGPPDEQYWLLTEENMPPGISRTTFIEETPSARLTRRDIKCSNDHRANTGDCFALINALTRDGNSIQNSPRDIRYNNCYVSWSAVISGARFELTPHAREVYNSCNSNGKISGLKRDVNIGGRSVTVCMSDRPKGCK